MLYARIIMFARFASLDPSNIIIINITWYILLYSLVSLDSLEIAQSTNN